ncbi:MAG: zinc-dependent metalloprotease [Myxococcales bacterium]
MRTFTKFLAAAALISACGGQPPAADPANEQFVTVGKSTGAVNTDTSTSDESFYLAIAKSQLGQKYFLSAYLTQYFPGAVGYGAARSMGTRVVTFKVQNGKLLVFDAADGKKDSNTFDPSLIVDAYPIVTGVLTGTNAQNYIAFDPSAGMNQFGALSDAFAQGQQPVKFNIDLSYLQKFRKISDGVTFEQVFTGYTDAGDPNSWLGGENNAFRGSGTLGIALRKYSEGKGFTPAPVYDSPFFFMGDIQLVPNSGQITANSIHWNFHPGMKPIQWKISDKVLNAQKDPNLKMYDVVGALKAGIENWNAVFGYKVFEASVATASDSYGDDDTNYVIWDEDPSFGAAFANWRNNPNTGEIRGASVYMNSLWLIDGDAYFNPDHQTGVRADGVPNQIAASGPHQPVPTLTWEGMQEKPLCLMFAPSQRPADDFVAGLVKSDPTVSPKQKVEAFLTHVLLHEIGHTLGLRHNFMGSLMPPSSSVMDYLDNDTSVLVTRPGAYDVDAIKLLYGMTQTPPAEPFCTDEDTYADPHCNQFDYPGDPLTGSYIPLYQGFLAQFMNGQSPSAPNNSLNNVLKFVRNGSLSEIPQAWAATVAGFKVGSLTSAQTGNPAYAARADYMGRRVLSRLFVDDPSLRGNFGGNPSFTNPAFPAMFNEINGNLLNSDGIRTFTTRRLMVDILSSFQIAAAYDALVQARAQIAAQRAGMTGATAEMTDDLLARIDAATHPYFK